MSNSLNKVITHQTVSIPNETRATSVYVKHTACLAQRLRSTGKTPGQVRYWSLTSLNNAGDQRQGKTQSLAGLYTSWCAVVSDDTTVCSSSGSSQLERSILRSCSCQTARQLTAKNPYYSRQIKPHVNTFYSRCVLRC